MSLILKQETSGNVPTPPVGKGTLYLNDSDQVVVKDSTGNTAKFPTITAAGNTQVFYNNDGVLDGSANFKFDNTTNTLTVLGNVAATGLKTDNIYYANGTPWDMQQPSGSTNQIQYNDAGNFGANANLVFNPLTNTLSSPLYAGTLTTAAQPNVTSTGTLSSLSVSGNANVGNIGADSGVFTNVSGNGSSLSSITGANVTGAVAYATTANSVAGANVSGQVTFAATANSVAGGNVSGAVAYATTANAVAGANVSGTVANATYAVTAGTANAVAGANVSGQVTFAATANSVAGANVSGAVAYATTANSVAGSNVSGQVSNATVAGTVYTAAQPNITSTGTLASLSVTANANVGNIGAAAGVYTANVSANNLSTTNTVTAGNGLQVTTGTLTVLAGNLDVTGNLNVTGNVNYSNVTDLVVGDPLIYLGANNTGDSVDLGIVASYNNGSYKHTGVARNASNDYWTFYDGVVAEPTTTIDWANATYPTVKLGNLIATGTLSSTGNANVGNIGATAGVFTTVAGSLTTGAQSNITSVGTLTSLSISGNANIGNIGTAGIISATGNANVGNIGAAAGVFTTITGSLVTASQPNVTSTGTLTTLSVSGNANIGNIGTGGLITATGNISTSSRLISSVATGTAPLVVSSTTQVANLSVATAGTATTAGTVTTNAQPNITSVGTLASLSVSGNANVGNIGTAGVIVSSIATGTAPLTVASTTKVVNLNVEQVDGYHADTANTVSTIVVRDAASNVAVGNVNAGGGYYTTLSASGNANVGNIGTGGLVTATGNITGANVIATTYNVTGVTIGISAAGTTQGTATALTKAFNVVSTVASGAGVVLPTAVAGMRLSIVNTSANSLLVYPASGGVINALATNGGYTMPTLGRLDYVATSSTQWYTMGAIYV